jgi:hypothetical protein
MSLPQALHAFLNNVGQAYKAREQNPYLLANAIRLDTSLHTTLQNAIRQVSTPIPMRLNIVFVETSRISLSLANISKIIRKI